MSESPLTGRRGRDNDDSRSPSAINNLGTQVARGVTGPLSATKTGLTDAAGASGPIEFTKAMATAPVDVSKSVAKGAIDIGYAATTAGVKTVGGSISAVQAGASAVPGVAAVANAAVHPREAVRPGPHGLFQDQMAGAASGMDREQIAATAKELATEEEELSSSTRSKLLAAACILEMMANFDAGVLPATVGHVMSEFNLDYADGGTLGALVYLGLVMGAPVAGWALTNFQSQRRILLGAAIVNCIGVLSFALAPTTLLLYVGRFMIGLTQAPLIIYLPVWVDEFAPPEAQASWMALLQASVAIGIMLGYVTAGLIVTYWGTEVCPELSCSAADPQCHHDTHGGHDGCFNPRWRVPLYIQAVGVLSFAPLYMWVKGRHFNARGGPSGRIEWRTAKYVRRMTSSHGDRLDDEYPATWDSDSWLQNEVHRFNYEESDLARLGEAPGALPTNHEQKKFDHKSKVHHMDAIDGQHLGESIGLMEIFHQDHSSSTESLTDSSVCIQLEMMMKSTLFVALTLSLSGLYYVVTGVQYWVTDYLTLPVAEGGMGKDTGLVVVCFFADIADSSHSRAAMVTLKTCCYFGIGAVAGAVPTAFGGDALPAPANFWFIMVTMWITLFFGGALLSPATGVCINSVHPDLRSFSSALSMFAFNILGYAAAPFSCGIIAQKWGLKWGFRITLLSSGVCFLGLFMAYVVAKREYHAFLAGSPTDDDCSEVRFDNPASKSLTPEIRFNNPSFDSDFVGDTEQSDKKSPKGGQKNGILLQEHGRTDSLLSNSDRRSSIGSNE